MSKVGIKSLRVHEGSPSEQTAVPSNINNGIALNFSCYRFIK